MPLNSIPPSQAEFTMLDQINGELDLEAEQHSIDNYVDSGSIVTLDSDLAAAGPMNVDPESTLARMLPFIQSASRPVSEGTEAEYQR